MSPTELVSARHKLNIDTLRGLACLLLVSFHVVGVPDAGLRLPDSHWLVYINEVLAYLRMPLFSFISGYVYAARPFKGDATRFMRGKMRRLLLPLLTIGTLFAVVQQLTPGTNAEVDNWWLLHVVPVGHFWFLEALFIIFVLIVGLERLKWLSTPVAFALSFGVSLLLFAFASLPPYFAASGVVYLLPFFLAGLACRRFDIRSTNAQMLAVALLLASAVWLGTAPATEGNSLAGLSVGLCSAFLLLRSGWQARWLAFVGSYSFAIYLMHVFFTAASRLYFTSMGVTDPHVHLLLGTTAGVVGPMAAASLIGRSAQLELWLLGKAPP